MIMPKKCFQAKLILAQKKLKVPIEKGITMQLFITTKKVLKKG